MNQQQARKKGYFVRAFGAESKNQSRWQCGDGAIKELLNLPFNIQITETKAFLKIQSALIENGYVPGLTYQSIPYDFSTSMQLNNLNENFVDNLKRLK